MFESVLLAIPDAAEIFEWFVQNASYILVFSLMVVESSFIPFPSEIVVPPAAYLACASGSNSDMNIYMIVVAATAGAIVGALVNYYLSLWIGRPIVYKFANSKIGHACLIDQAKVEKAEQYFDKHGAISTFIGRLIPAVRQLISIPAGLARMHLGKFVIFTGLGAMLWNIILAGLGWWLAEMVSLNELYDKIEEYNAYLSYAGIALGVFCVLFILWNVYKHRNKTNSPNTEK